jgi:hypothetical protein
MEWLLIVAALAARRFGGLGVGVKRQEDARV